MSKRDLGPEGLSLNDMVASANDAAVTARNVTTAMLATAVTLLATILASSDEAILRDQLTAPFGLGVAMRLSTAYALMPPVFLFLHVNGLLQLHVLAERLRLFEQHLQQYVGVASERDKWRRRLHGFAFVQHFSDDEARTEPEDKLLEYNRNLLLMTVNLVTIGVVPLTLLIATLVSFLRYQDETITLLHRVIVMLDLAFIVWFYVSQSRLSRRASERPSVLLFIGAAIVALGWLMGFNAWLSGALICGLLTAWAVIVVGRVTKTRRLFVVLLLTPFILLLGFGIWWAIGAHVAFLAAWGVGLGGAVGASAIWQSISLGWLSGLAQHRLVTWALWAARYGPLPLAIFWFADSQAVVPDGTEPACQVRWDWGTIDQELATRKANSGSSELPSDGLVSATFAWLSDQKIRVDANIAIGIDYVIMPLFGAGQTSCDSPDDEGSPQANGRFRANLLDRWTCAEWGIGCRFLSLPSAILLASSQNAAAIEKLRSLSDDERQEATLRSLGLALRDRRLRFARLSEARLYGVDLRRADLRGAELNSANLSGALLSSSDLQQSNLAMTVMSSADLTSANLRDANLSGAQLDSAILDGASLLSAALAHSNLQRASLQHVLLADADLSRASLRGAYLRGTTFYGADLVEAQLQSAIVIDSQFEGASLLGAQLSQALIVGSSFDGSSLEDASLIRAAVINTTLRGTSGHLVQCSEGLFLDVEDGPWPQDDFENFVSRKLQNGQAQDDRITRILRRIIGAVTQNRDQSTVTMCDVESTLADQSPVPFSQIVPNFEAFASSQANTACSDEVMAGAIVRSLLEIESLKAGRSIDQLRKLTRTFASSLLSRLDEPSCSGLERLHNDEKAQLRQAAGRILQKTK